MSGEEKIPSEYEILQEIGRGNNDLGRKRTYMRQAYGDGTYKDK